MTLLIATPDTYPAERDYILGVIFSEFLGLPWKRVRSADAGIHLRLSDAPGEISLPDHFFAHPDHTWLTPTTVPQTPLPIWDTRSFATDINLTDPRIPLITDPASQQHAAGWVESPTAQQIHLPIDLFGSAFFMLSRYEEAVLPNRDDHDRFPATASLAYRAGFLDRPIVDEYVEILWCAMQRLWPRLQRRPHQARTCVSCDVDSPFEYPARPGTARALASTGSQVGRRLAGDLLKRRSIQRAAGTLRGLVEAWRGDDGYDSHRQGLEYIMDVNERAGRPVAFYFIPENTNPRFDNHTSLDQLRMRKLLREIYARGHEIGLHPGYDAYRHPDTFARSVTSLRRVLDEEGIDQAQIGGRQHYLRWETPTTASLCEANGLDYDTTLGYADRPGFRCGTCRDYPLYDPTERRPLRLRERPLILMECTVIAKHYLGLGYSDQALTLMQAYRDTCHRFGGDFTLLWHNCRLSNAADRRFYEALAG